MKGGFVGHLQLGRTKAYSCQRILIALSFKTDCCKRSVTLHELAMCQNANCSAIRTKVKSSSIEYGIPVCWEYN